MDADRFDAALRWMAAGPTRRGAMLALGGLGLAALLGANGIDAKRKKRKRKRKGKKKRRASSACPAPCPVCQTCRGGQCVPDSAQNRAVCAGSGIKTSVCCNGGCCDGCCGVDGSCGPCRVFVTSTLYTSKLGGLTGADAKCQERAAAGNQPGAYMAWLSTTDESPDTRFRRSAQPYRMTNGVDIASSYTDLVTREALAAPLDRTELGLPVSAGAWTNTQPDGTRGSSLSNMCPPNSVDLSCTDWTSDGFLGGGVGTVVATNCTWTAAFNGDCDDENRLYCFQQR